MTLPGPLDPPKPAEDKILSAIGGDEPIEIGAKLPPPGDADSEVRAEFLVHLLLHLSDRINHRGLRLCGAWISGSFDLSGAKVVHRLYFEKCRFDATPRFNDSEIRTLVFDGAACPGIVAYRVKIDGTMVMVGGFEATGPVKMLDAKIQGNFECEQANYHDGGNDDEDGLGFAILLERARIAGTLFMRDGFESLGSVRLYQAEISGNLEIENAKFYGTSSKPKANTPKNVPICAINLEKAVIKGSAMIKNDVYISGGIRLYEASVQSLELEDAGIYADSTDAALDARLAKIDGALLIQSDVTLSGRVDLSQASARMILVDYRVWPKGETFLDGFTFDRFADSALLSDADTVEWLMRQPEEHFDNFRAQPWEQCARVLLDTGHGHEATRLMVAKERLRRARLRRQEGPARAALSAVKDVVLDQTIRFGYQPLRAGLWLIVFVVLGWGLFSVADARSALVPAESDPPRFQALIFAFDSFVPVIDLGQAEAYRASDAPQGRIWLWVLSLYQLLGWALAGVWVAGFTGLVRK